MYICIWRNRHAISEKSSLHRRRIHFVFITFFFIHCSDCFFCVLQNLGRWAKTKCWSDQALAAIYNFLSPKLPNILALFFQPSQYSLEYSFFRVLFHMFCLSISSSKYFSSFLSTLPIFFRIFFLSRIISYVSFHI